MSISNQDDYIDGNELAGEIETLRDDIDEKRDEVKEAKEADEESELNDPALLFELEDALDDLEQELKPLAELEDSIFFSLGDVSLISDDAFEEYAQRFAIDSGDVSESSGVFSYINWENYARDLRIDFTSVDFDGTEYLYRS